MTTITLCKQLPNINLEPYPHSESLLLGISASQPQWVQMYIIIPLMNLLLVLCPQVLWLSWLSYGCPCSKSLCPFVLFHITYSRSSLALFMCNIRFYLFLLTVDVLIYEICRMSLREDIFFSSSHFLFHLWSFLFPCSNAFCKTIFRLKTNY